jgi:RNA polymerase sigma factor (sigma-70 family)
VRLDELVRRAVDGDRNAVRELVVAIQDDIYGIAIRMLWVRVDAEDATQEILVRVVTRLAQFDFRASFRTWVYRVAVNYLLDVRKSAVERMRMTFQAMGEDLATGLSDAGPPASEHSVLVEEVKLGCTFAMLQCLDRGHRAAYILGEILDLPAPEAAAALDIDAAAFRKRLERSRARITEHLVAHCGLVSDVACRCHRRVPAALALGRVHPDRQDFADRGISFEEVKRTIRGVESARRALEVHRSSIPRKSDVDFARRVVSALERIAD